MKVKELIQQLSQLDPEAVVVVDGYEDGLIEPLPPSEVEVVMNVHPEEYYGPHDLASSGEVGQQAKAVYLRRPLR
jgi:hypothetical protein